MKRTRLKSYLKAVIAKHGMDVLLNGQKTVNLIAVTFNHSVQERHLLKLVYEHGVMDELIAALKGADALEAVDNSVQKLKAAALMPEDEAERLVRDIADAIKLQVPRRPKAGRKPQNTAQVEAQSLPEGEAAGGKPKIDMGAVKEKLSEFKSKYLDKIIEWFKSLKLEENAKQMLADSKLSQKIAGYLLRDDGRLGERGRKILNVISVIAALTYGAGFVGFYMLCTGDVSLAFTEYSHPFISAFYEYLFSFIVFFFVDLRCELKADNDFTKDKLFRFCFWSLVAIPLIASLGNGVNLFACILRVIPAFLTGFFGLVMGKIAGKDVQKRTNWSKKYLISASVIGLFLIVFSFVIF